MTNWKTMNTAPTDGSKFDVWCVDPKSPSSRDTRFTGVQMRGDGSGFGYVMHFSDGVGWQYLDAREPYSLYPEWLPTHWMYPPKPPVT